MSSKGNLDLFREYSPPGLCQIAGAILGASAISGGTSLLGGICGANAASTASQQQMLFEQQALQFQEQVYQQNTANLTPFLNLGQDYLAPTTLPDGTKGPSAYEGVVNNILNTPAMVWNPTEAQLQSTPGYQFTLSQMLGQTRNALSATGTAAAGTTGTTAGGGGGPMTTADMATLKTAGNIADTTYNQQYQNWLAQQGLTMQQQNQKLATVSAPVDVGLRAGGAIAGVGLQSGIPNTLGAMGATAASGTIGAANALTGGLTGVGNAAASGVTNSALLPLLLAGNTGSAAGVGGLGGVTDVGGGGDAGTSGFGSTAVDAQFA